MKRARIRDAAVTRRYHTTNWGATSAVAAHADAPRTTADTGTFHPPRNATTATRTMGISHNAAAALWKDDHLRGSRQRASATTHASAPAHSTAACPSSTPVRVASRGALHGCSEKWRRSTCDG